jgi:DNA-binding NarL/FixJ family response regulator
MSKSIGKALFISNKTVSSYKTRIMDKLSAESSLIWSTLRAAVG